MTLDRTRAFAAGLAATLALGGPAARATDVLTIDSLTPSSGPVQIVPGGADAAAAALNPSNTIVARVTFPSAASYQKVHHIGLGGSSIPESAPSGHNGPHLVLKPFRQMAVAGTGPVHATVEFGWSCYANSIPQTTFTSIEVVGMENPPLTTPGYVVAGRIRSSLVVKCPQPVANIPHAPFAAPTPVRK